MSFAYPVLNVDQCVGHYHIAILIVNHISGHCSMLQGLSGRRGPHGSPGERVRTTSRNGVSQSQ